VSDSPTSETGHHRITRKSVGTVPYVYIDYEGLEPAEMIELLDAVINFSTTHPIPFIANFKNCKITPAYLKKSNEWIAATKELVRFGCFLGLGFSTAFLLESYLSLHGLKHKHYDSYEEAEMAIQISGVV
jgi:hypothetical protein